MSLAMDALPLLYVGCDDGVINVYRHSAAENWKLLRSLSPTDRFVGGPIAVLEDGVLFADVGEFQDSIDVFAPGAYGNATPMHQLPGVGAIAVAVDPSGVLYVAPGNYTHTLVYEYPQSEDHFDLEILPTNFEENYYGAVTVDKHGKFWTHLERGDGFVRWQAADFAQRDHLDPRQDR